MIDCPRMAIIGATGRNAGKTEFACELIRRHTGNNKVVAVKITTVQERDGQCPRGGKGCGVCSSLTENFCLTEETVADTSKDTSRMLRAGAGKVFWLRVLRSHLEEGTRALLAQISEDALIVCESNSLRTVLKPGVFVVVTDATTSGAVKPSCAEVLNRADLMLRFDGSGWDSEPSRLAVAARQWILRPDATAVILAGGASRRMGRDKSLLEWHGRPLLAHVAAQLDFFPELLIGSNDASAHGFPGIHVVPDRIPGQGPLMGILSCVAQASHEYSFVTGCDIPDLDIPLVLRLLSVAPGHDVAIVQTPDGLVEPLLAVYRKTVVPAAEDALRSGARRVVDMFGGLKVIHVPADTAGWYHNLNTPDDFEQWRVSHAKHEPKTIP